MYLAVSIQRAMPILVLIFGVLTISLDIELTPVATFPVFTIATLLMEPLVRAPPEYRTLARTIQAINRIRDFLLQEEYVDTRIRSNRRVRNGVLEKTSANQNFMSLSELYVQRSNSDAFVLQNISCTLWK